MAGSLDRGGDPYPPARKKENQCCSTASTSTLRSVRSRTLDCSHSAVAKRGGRSIARTLEESTEPGNEDAWSKVD